MSTAVTRIQLKYSTGTAAPTSLATAEPAYSYSSNTFFIGSPDGAGVIAIGGKFYLDQQQLAWNHANAAFSSANAGTGAAFAYNHANSAFYHANAAFTAANNATDTYVRNHANAAFDTANGAVAVNLTQNNSITVALNTANAAFYHANAAFANANSYITYNEAVSVTQNNSITAAFAAANAATATDVTQNNSITSAFIHANAAFASANNIDGVNVTQNNSITVALNTANAAYTRANNSVDANNGGTITGDVIINANLFVNGTTTFVNTVNQLIGDNIITLNADLGQSSQPTQDSGFEVERGIQPNSSILWIESAAKWSANNGNSSYYLASEATLTAAYNTANATSIRANNSLDANNGGVVTGNVDFTGTLKPTADVTWNLGSPDKRWHSLFVGSGTIDIGGLTIKNTSVNSIDTATIGGVRDLKLTDAAFGSVGQIASQANAAFNSANAAFANANSYITYAEAVNVTQNNNITAALNTANAAFSNSNTYITYNEAVNVTQNNSIAAAFSAANGAIEVNTTQNNSITVALNTANAAFASANNIDGVNITQNNSIAAAFSAGNTAATLQSAINLTQNNSITVALNTANASFNHANAAFTAANNATDTYVRNHANAAFDTANSAVAVNVTQNNSIAASFAHANAAFSTANSAASAASSAQGTADSAASAASAAQGTADGAVAVNVTQNTNITTANNTAVAAFKHANAAFAQANTYATASAAVFNGTGDGSTKSFNLGYAPVSDGSASVVSIDGIVQ